MDRCNVSLPFIITPHVIFTLTLNEGKQKVAKNKAAIGPVTRPVTFIVIKKIELCLFISIKTAINNINSPDAKAETSRATLQCQHNVMQYLFTKLNQKILAI